MSLPSSRIHTLADVAATSAREGVSIARQLEHIADDTATEESRADTIRAMAYVQRAEADFTAARANLAKASAHLRTVAERGAVVPKYVPSRAA